MKIGFIYVHKHKVSGKCYVGQTWQQPERRWRKQDPTYKSYKSCEVFYKALLKYGWEGFDSFIVATGTSIEEVNSLEEKYIKEFNTLNGNGYNLRELSEGRAFNSVETRAKISDKLKGVHLGKARPNLRTPHVFIDGIEHKECPTCKEIKPLTQFGTHNRINRNKTHMVGDGKAQYCIPCRNEYSKKYKYKRVSEEQFKESRKIATANMTKTIRDKFVNDPDYKRRISIAKGPAYKGVASNGDILIVECGQDLKDMGFNLSAVCNGIKKGRPSQGYTWAIIPRNEYVKPE